MRKVWYFNDSDEADIPESGMLWPIYQILAALLIVRSENHIVFNYFPEASVEIAVDIFFYCIGSVS